MDFKKATFFFLLLTLSLAYVEEESVIVLKDSDYPGVFKQFPNLMVELYAPWQHMAYKRCGHCKTLAPIYTEIAQDYQSQGSDVRLAKVDATAEKLWGEKFGVSGFPTLVFVKNGKQIPFKSTRTKEGIMNWLDRKAQDPVRQLTAESYKEVKESNLVAIVFHGDLTSDQGKSIQRMAMTDDFNTYFYGKSLGGRQGLVQMFRPFAQPVVYPKVDYKLKAWINANDRPIVVQFDDRTQTYAFGDGKPLIILFNGATGENTQQASKTFLQLANKYTQDNPNKLKFCEIKKSEKQYGEWAQHLKIDAEAYPIVITHKAKQNKYVLNGSTQLLDAEIINKFINSWSKGIAKGYKLDEQVKPVQQKKSSSEL